MNLDRLIAVRNTKTVYRDGNRCIKVFHANHSKADILDEARNQARMEEIGLKVPKLLEVTTFNGNWAIVSEFIRGKTMAQLMRENPCQTEAYLALLIQLQLSVLSKTCAALNDLKSTLRYGICKASLEEGEKKYLFSRLNTMPEQDFICHGDFSPSNLILSEDGTPYIIDWAHAARGNALADAAGTYLSFLLSDDAESAENYLNLFCGDAGVDKQAVFKWIPLVAAFRSVRVGTKKQKVLFSLVNAATGGFDGRSVEAHKAAADKEIKAEVK